jgi:ectoine hydroxylase-related dioxygenase (phytanoyl-CoA dioxygenase family)
MDFLKTNTYGITEQFELKEKYDHLYEDIFFNGYTVVENVLSKEVVESLKTELAKIYKTQSEEFGVENLKKINDENIVRAPLVYSDEYIKLACNEYLINLSKKIFGDNFILLMQNGIINSPVNSQFQSKWHRDLNYQHWVTSKILAINALFTLTDFTFETGATHVLPSTHLKEVFPSERFVKENEKCLTAPAGSVIIMDAMLYHRAGVNVSKADRIGINHVIGLPFLNPQIDLSGCLNLPEQYKNYAQYFGFKWSSSKTPLEWRKKKLV